MGFAAILRGMGGRIAFASLGCAKALVDSEQLMARLRALGYEFVSRYEDADLAIVNTCGFITPAIEESLEAIGEAMEGVGKVVATGCLGARPGVIEKAHPNVLSITGPEAYDEVLEAVMRVLPPDRDPKTALVPGRVPLTPRHYAYLKIAEGCDNRCSFCIIPKLRGPQRSRTAAEVLAEAARLVASGTRELLVIAQDTVAYGRDLRYAKSEWAGRQWAARISELVRGLSELGVWVRLHYVYPYPEVDDLVGLMAEGLLLPYLDVPLQHASPSVLRAMRRPGGAEDHLERIARWRKTVPDLTIRSTFIVGFPGESESDFELLLDFLREARLDRVGVFPYSAVEGAAANEYPGAVPEEVKQERYDRVMALQAEISAERMRARIGQALEVIVDGPAETPGVYLARTKGDSPGVDGVVYLRGDGIKAGERYLVRVSGADTYDLFAEVVRPLPWRTPLASK